MPARGILTARVQVDGATPPGARPGIVAAELLELTPYAVESRYPGAWDVQTRADARRRGARRAGRAQRPGGRARGSAAYGACSAGLLLTAAGGSTGGRRALPTR